MKVSLDWLKELVDYNLSPQELADILSLKSIGVKELTDNFLELDLTYNRGDLLSLRGVAREVAAITGSRIIFQDQPAPKKDLPGVAVKVEDSKLCPVYCVAKIENLKVEQSNETWVKKLSDSGIRTVNNIADITNLIMIEYGQPMHAFDARAVQDEAIIVRAAKEGERITTLDGKTRDLESSDLLIADSLNALGIAGVMGGKDSEISDTTTTILLEAAIFDPVSNRDTSKRHGLHSEASKRFQHGLTKTNLLQALSAAIKMYEELGGKLVGLSIVGDTKDAVKTIKLTQEKIHSLIGVDIPTNQVESSLKKLGFILASQGETLRAWEVTVPYWRLDINIEEDLIEEVARIYGYEKIPAKPLEGKVPEKLNQILPQFIYDLKVALKNAGLTEVQTYSFYSSKVIVNCQFSVVNLVKIANPISSETEYLREFIWPNLVEVVAKNLRQGFSDIAIFEVGKVYQPQQKDLPKEPYRLAVALMNGSDNPIQELNAIFTNLSSWLVQDQKSKDSGVVAKAPPQNDIVVKPGGMMEELKALFHPKRFATVNVGGKVVGGLAEVHPRVLNKFGTEKRVAILEIALTKLL